MIFTQIYTKQYYMLAKDKTICYNIITRNSKKVPFYVYKRRLS